MKRKRRHVGNVSSLDCAAVCWRARLTFKGPMRLEGNLKVREEREVGIESAEEGRALL